MDMNKVWLSGLAITQPILTKLGGKTPFTTFTLQVNERFNDRDGKRCIKPNLLKIESLGRSAATTVSKVKEGMRYVVDGYLRQDSGDEGDYTRVRSFAVYKEDSETTSHYIEGLRQALEVMHRSRNIDSAKKVLEDLINAT